MKNYYDMQKKLELDKRGLKFLYRQRESLESLVEPKSVVTDKIAIDLGTISPDKNLAAYVDAKSSINKDIEAKKKEIVDLESELQAMEKILRGVQDIRYKIFVMRFLDNMSSRQIARKLQYSRRRVDQLIEIIKSNLLQ